MKIETKYNIGDKVWIVYEPEINSTKSGEISIYTDTIAEIIFYKNEIVYDFDLYPDELKESEIILYDEKDKLLAKIEELTNKIEERERNK